MSIKTLALTTAAVTALSATSALARDTVEVSGSSTVYPYAVMSADSFADAHDFAYPNVESGGSSAGLKKFCAGVGPDTIDIANASRKIKAKEIKACADNGVTEIIEVRIGYDGLVFANEAGDNSYDFSPADWYRALGAQVMVDGALVANSFTSWSEVNAAFADTEIRTFIPTKKHGTREVFDKKLILAGCKDTGAYDAFVAENGGDAKAAEKSCYTLRDGDHAREIEGGGKDVLDAIRSINGGIGVVGLAFYEGNADSLQAAAISGVLPSSDSIATGDYPVSRPLFMYVKKAHIGTVPGLKEYVQSVLSDEMSGPGGFLTLFGLVSDPAIADTRSLLDSETVMDLNS